MTAADHDHTTFICDCMADAPEVTRSYVCAICGGTGSQPTHRTDCPLHGAGYIGRHEGAPSIFDQPDAGFVYAIERGRQLAATLDDVVLSGDDGRKAEWMGSAAAILLELTK